MIIQCDQCQTKFRLPDEKLKPAGVKVRCSHCKHVFTVMPPEPPAEEAPAPVEEKVKETAGQPEPEAEEKPTATEAFASEEAAAEQPAAPGEEEPGMSEGGPSEFDFGDFDEPSGEEEFAASTDEGPDESSELDFSSAFDEDESAFAAEESEEKGKTGFGVEEEAAGPTEFAFEEEAGAEDFGFGEESAGGEFDFEEETGGDEFDSDDAGSEPDAFDFGDENPFAEEESTGAAPEEKEFKFTELPSEAAGEPREAAASSDLFAPSAMEAGPSETGGGLFEEEMPLPGGTETATKPAPPPRRSKKKKSPISRVVTLVFLLLLVLIGGVGYLYWQQGEIGLPAVDDLVARLVGGDAGQVKGSIEIGEQAGRYVTNQEVGTLLVIEGQAVNRYPTGRANIQVQAVLYDAGGRIIRRQNAYCGNRFTDQQLKQMPFAKIDESMKNAFGEALSNIDVSSGKSIPFTVVFKDLPENLDSFSVEAVGSQPASAQ